MTDNARIVREALENCTTGYAEESSNRVCSGCGSSIGCEPNCPVQDAITALDCLESELATTQAELARAREEAERARARIKELSQEPVITDRARAILYGEKIDELKANLAIRSKALEEGSRLLAEVFNQLTAEQKNAAPDEVAEQIGRFMVDNGYRMVFTRRYLQSPPRAALAPEQKGE